MKITIELTDAEVKGIKEYLKETDGIEKPSKDDIRNYCTGELQAIFQSGNCAVSEYISKFESHS